MSTAWDTHEQRLGRLAAAARASAVCAEDDREARDAAIEAANLDGWSVRRIADATGMSSSRVQAVILARAAARQARLAHAAGLA